MVYSVSPAMRRAARWVPLLVVCLRFLKTVSNDMIPTTTVEEIHNNNNNNQLRQDMVLAHRHGAPGDVKEAGERAIRVQPLSKSGCHLHTT